MPPFGGIGTQAPLDASNVQRAHTLNPEQGALMKSVLLAALVFLAAATDASQLENFRELVRLPEPMQEHMLGNMSDHLATLNEIIGDVADGKFDEAAKLSEQRLGNQLARPSRSAHMAPFMPKPMQDIGTSMHRAASRSGSSCKTPRCRRRSIRCATSAGPFMNHDNLCGVSCKLSNSLRC